jgi:plastocyanin
MQLRRRLLKGTATGFAAVLALSAASFFPGAVEAQAQVSPVQTGPVIVEMTEEMTFDPPSLTVPVGTMVQWVNVSASMGHSATADPDRAFDSAIVVLPLGAESFDSGLLPPGATFEHTFDVPGRYVYFCIPHEDEGMIGEIIVE